MAKSKKKSLILRCVEGDFKLKASRQVSMRIPRAQFPSQSLVHSNHDSLSQASPPRTRVVFLDFTIPSSGVRVSSKCKNKAMQQTRSLTSYDSKGISSGGSRASTPASTEQARSTPYMSNLYGLPFWPTTTLSGTSPQPLVFFPTFTGCFLEVLPMSCYWVCGLLIAGLVQSGMVDSWEMQGVFLVLLAGSTCWLDCCLLFPAIDCQVVSWGCFPYLVAGFVLCLLLARSI
ncbi:hypothetical protein NC653_034010 [Populus alba x Populus x berolinensis]|uniref:Uncharacterized protein n=1 Tax=Populus alba x Populus x berolinensis TaxID=444605 RepID=A0AAD6LV40_9ROSI|nr:hypothetical protein NC653_034010 [Populus alba x Populus x berolinensis]